MQTPQHRCTLPQRIRAGCDRDATLKDYFRQLCHSAFVRVATVTSKQLPLRRSFATAHSCGLRRDIMSKQDELLTLPQRIRAGCDQRLNQRNICTLRLCHSAFVRVATPRVSGKHRRSAFATAHSCGLRLGHSHPICGYSILCHSAFVRVATRLNQRNICTLRLCHSAFVRVATNSSKHILLTFGFATAHSCGLRL